MRENKVIGRAKLGEKYRKERWVIEEVLNKDCGLYKIRQEGHEAKIIHRKNIRPLKEGRNKTQKDAEQVEDDTFDTITNTSEGDMIGGHDSNDDTEIDFETREDSEVEMPDMAEVLERFGIGTNIVRPSCCGFRFIPEFLIESMILGAA